MLVLLLCWRMWGLGRGRDRSQIDTDWLPEIKHHTNAHVLTLPPRPAMPVTTWLWWQLRPQSGLARRQLCMGPFSSSRPAMKKSGSPFIIRNHFPLEEEDKEEEVSFSLIAPRNIAVVARSRVSCQAVTYGMECILTAHRSWPAH